MSEITAATRDDVTSNGTTPFARKGRKFVARFQGYYESGKS